MYITPFLLGVAETVSEPEGRQGAYHHMLRKDLGHRRRRLRTPGVQAGLVTEPCPSLGCS